MLQLWVTKPEIQVEEEDGATVLTFKDPVLNINVILPAAMVASLTAQLLKVAV